MPFVEMIILPAFKVLLGIFIFLLGFWTYGTSHFYRDPGSVLFYDRYRAFERKYSAFREKEVLTLREKLLKSDNIIDIPKAGEKPSLCALFITANRKTDDNSIHPAEVRVSLLQNLGSRNCSTLLVQVLCHSNTS
jgi:hypothetical protein